MEAALSTACVAMLRCLRTASQSLAAWASARPGKVGTPAARGVHSTWLRWKAEVTVVVGREHSLTRGAMGGERGGRARDATQESGHPVLTALTHQTPSPIPSGERTRRPGSQPLLLLLTSLHSPPGAGTEPRSPSSQLQSPKNHSLPRAGGASPVPTLPDLTLQPPFPF